MSSRFEDVCWWSTHDDDGHTVSTGHTRREAVAAADRPVSSVRRRYDDGEGDVWAPPVAEEEE